MYSLIALLLFLSAAIQRSPETWPDLPIAFNSFQLNRAFVSTCSTGADRDGLSWFSPDLETQRMSSTLSDPTTDWTKYNTPQPKLPPMLNPPPRPPGEETNPPFQAWLDWQKSSNGFTLPEADLHNVSLALPDGRMSFARTPARIYDSIMAEALKPDSSKIRVPGLAFIQGSLTVQQRVFEYRLTNDQDPKTAEQFWSMDRSYMKKFIRDLKNGVPGAPVIEVSHPNHFVFLSNQAEVLHEMAVFLARLDAAAK